VSGGCGVPRVGRVFFRPGSRRTHRCRTTSPPLPDAVAVGIPGVRDRDPGEVSAADPHQREWRERRDLVGVRTELPGARSPPSGGGERREDLPWIVSITPHVLSSARRTTTSMRVDDDGLLRRSRSRRGRYPLLPESGRTRRVAHSHAAPSTTMIACPREQASMRASTRQTSRRSAGVMIRSAGPQATMRPSATTSAVRQ